jgi:hypothetical protein
MRLEATESAETGFWWLREAAGSALPYSDRLEKSLVNYLLRHSGSTFFNLETALNAEFPSLLTPDLELINVCLDSYAIQEPPESDRWFLRDQDVPAARRQDLETAHAQLKTLAERLGYEMEGTPPVWLDEKGEPLYQFYISASAVIGEHILENPGPAARSIIVLPGSRANLVAFKLRRDPRLRALCAAVEATPGITVPGELASGEGSGSRVTPTVWRFLKFRHLRQLLDNLLLDSSNLDALLSQDPHLRCTPNEAVLVW